MRRFCDSASVPSETVLGAAHSHGVRGWAGYLPSPFATRSWSADELNRVLRQAGALLPVYVAPFPADKIVGAKAHDHAAQALHGLAELRNVVAHGTARPTKLPLVLDIEASVYYKHPAATLDYFAAFVAAVGDHAAVIPYSVPACLLAIKNHHEHARFVWAASWRTDATWPAAVAPIGLGAAWQGLRAWQYHGGIARFGMDVDLNVADDAFAFALHHSTTAPAPAPAPAPTPAKKTAEATVVVDGVTYRGTLTNV